MRLEDDSSICACGECAALIADKAKSVPEEQNRPSVSGSGLKKFYHAPVLTVYGSLSEPDPLEVDSRKI